MKALVLYSSETGRTKKLAEAVRSVLPVNTDFLPMEQAPEHFDDYDIVFVGVWFLNLRLDEKSRSVLPRLKAKKVAIFATMHRDLFLRRYFKEPAPGRRTSAARRLGCRYARRLCRRKHGRASLRHR